jgi:signal transduction histidine kinase
MARLARSALDTLATRIALVALAVAMVAIVTIGAGVLVVGAWVFQQVMLRYGESPTAIEGMWRSAVVEDFAAAAVLACLLSGSLGAFLAWRITRPLKGLTGAARRLAEGDRDARVDPAGPRELAAVASAFNQMADSLAVQERQRAELVANFAHELRTPLTNLRGYLEAMRDGVMAPSPQLFDSLREEVWRLERLSRDLDLLGGDGRGGDGAGPAVMDVTGAINGAVELARPGFERNGLRLQVELPAAGQLCALVVPDHLSQVLSNLLQNAQRYTPRGGCISVSARADDGCVLVSVANTGAEIPAADLPHLFERFYRVDKSRDRATGGAGIGLAIVKQLVEQGGGRVGVESGRAGTRVFFHLPTAS